MGSMGSAAGFAKFEPGDVDQCSPNCIELGLAGGRESGCTSLLAAMDGHGPANSTAAAEVSRENALVCWGYSAGRGRGQPACMAPNWTVRPYIHWYYRDVLTLRQALASLWYCHNETGNVMTHLGGLLVFVLFFIRDLLFRELPHHHRVVACSYLLVAQYCMGSSAAFHLLGPVSKRGYELALRCDMTGIALVIISSFMIGIHYGYWCHARTGHIYLAIVGVLSCISLVWPYVPALFRNFNASVAFFASFVAFALVPLFHWCFLVGGPNRSPTQLHPLATSVPASRMLTKVSTDTSGESHQFAGTPVSLQATGHIWQLHGWLHLLRHAISRKEVARQIRPARTQSSTLAYLRLHRRLSLLHCGL
jgi:predicted membrane channel-forming protein YqfA (hemolysin III family)